MTIDEIIKRIEAIRYDCAENSQPSRSGYIDPTEADLAREEGARGAYEEVASSLASLLKDARALTAQEAAGTTMVSNAAVEFARQQFRDFLGFLLDDPSDLVHPDNNESPREILTRHRQLASDLGLDFDGLVAEIGTDFEQRRLSDIEAGVETTWRRPGR